MGLQTRRGFGPAFFNSPTMAKSKIKIWAERHALMIAARFFLTFFWPMAFVSLAMIALALLIFLIAALPDAPVV